MKFLIFIVCFTCFFCINAAPIEEKCNGFMTKDTNNISFTNLSYLHSYLNVDPTIRSSFYFPNDTQIEIEMKNSHLTFHCGNKADPTNIYNQYNYKSYGTFFQVLLLQTNSTTDTCTIKHTEAFSEMYLLDYEEGRHALFFKCGMIDAKIKDRVRTKYIGMFLIVSERNRNLNITDILSPTFLNDTYYTNIDFPSKRIVKYTENKSSDTKNQCENVKNHLSNICNPSSDRSTKYVQFIIFVAILFFIIMVYKILKFYMSLKSQGK